LFLNEENHVEKSIHLPITKKEVCVFMSVINYTSKEIFFKIVYYGCAMCGKTSNLQYVHSATPQKRKGNLVSLATESDRTLYFDFLPVDAIKIQGFDTKFQLYTVPGQVYYNSTRKMVLKGVDGIVFVVDSQWDKMEENVESFYNLGQNLAEYEYSLDEIPYVLQYNKRDLDSIAPVHYLEYLSNRRKTHVYSFESVATAGEGVFSTLNQIAKLVLHKMKQELKVNQ